MNVSKNSAQTDIRVLLVDDEDTFRHNIARLLASRQVFSLEAENGEACLSVLATTPVDVVVLDVKMPGMSGLEVLRRIRETYPNIEVILLTGQASASDGVEGIKSGAFDYLFKPVEIEHLAGKIRQAREKQQHLEAHRQEAEFRVAMEKQMIATERLAALGTLAAGVAHEINNPLSIIKQSVKWLFLRMENHSDQAGVGREDLEKALRNIDTAVERARRITHQLLGSARKSKNNFARIELAKFIEDAFQLVDRTARDADVALQTHLAPGLEVVWGNPDGLRQVITNLLVNAVQATPSGGSVTISTEDAGDNYVIAVTDTGSGIPEENQARIFEPFFTTKEPGEGTGLGLYVTRSILDSLGGSISLESRVGRGACFRVRLPKAPPQKSSV